MNLTRLRDFTPARVALGRVGDSLPTRELLDFQLAHARARDAVHARLDTAALMLGRPFIAVASVAADRATYLRRPDLGRNLSDDSRRKLMAQASGEYDAIFVIGDGLSALAVHRHAAAVLDAVLSRLQDWQVGPIVVAEQARVAIGDEIGQVLKSQM